MTLETDAAGLVVAAGVAPEPALVSAAIGHLRRARRVRRFSVAGGILLAAGPLQNDHHNVWAGILLAGFLLGLLMSELLAPRRKRPPLRSATLRPRSTRDLLPQGAWALPWLTLTPVVATPLLALGYHPRGPIHTAFDSANGCVGMGYWPSRASLFAAGALALTALVVVNVTLRRLVHRAQPADDLPTWRVDHALRCRSARSTVASATALGFVIAASVIMVVDEALHRSIACPLSYQDPALPVRNVYSWGSSLTPWTGLLPIALYVLAFAIWRICQELPSPKPNLGLMHA